FKNLLVLNIFYFFFKIFVLLVFSPLIPYSPLFRSPIVSLEDPLAEDVDEGFVEITRRLEDKVQIIGDDYFASSAERIAQAAAIRSEEHTSELQSRENIVCRLLLEEKTSHYFEFELS